MIYRLTGQVQHYAWGGKNYIASLIGLHSAKDQPCAEWWLGAHPSAPSEIEDVTGKQSLIEFLSQNPTALGQASHQQFGDELPYLLKILDVENRCRFNCIQLKHKLKRALRLRMQRCVINRQHTNL